MVISFREEEKTKTFGCAIQRLPQTGRESTERCAADRGNLLWAGRYTWSERNVCSHLNVLCDLHSGSGGHESPLIEGDLTHTIKIG